MNKITVEIPIRETVEREIQLPAYRTDGTAFVKIESEYSYIKAYNSGECYNIQKWDLYAGEFFKQKDMKECTREEFEQAYYEVLGKLSMAKTIHA